MHPILLEIQLFGNLHIVDSYSVFNLVLNPSVFVILGVAFLRREGSCGMMAFLSVFLLMVWVIIGSRLAWVVLALPQYLDGSKNPFAFAARGFTMFGGFVLAVPFVRTFSKIADVDMWRYLDAIAPGWAIGIFFNKIGCHLNGCCVGIPTESFLGVSFPMFSHPHPLLPVQLMEAGMGLAGFLLVLTLRKNRKVEGTPFAVFAFVYAISRLVFHFLRETPTPVFFSQSGLISLYAAFVILTFFVLLYRVKKDRTPSE